MKTKIHILIILCCFPFAVSAQWNPLDNFSNGDKYMEVINQDTLIYSRNSSGYISRTTDGGNTWTGFQTILYGSWIYDFDFPTNQIGYGCGGSYFDMYKDVILKTEDAGETWDTLTTNSFGIYAFQNIEFLNVDTGFVSAGTLLLKTEDGGQNFTPVNISENNVLVIHALASTPNGIVFTTTSRQVSQGTFVSSIYRSDDIGENWLQVYSDTIENVESSNNRFIEAVNFPTTETGYAVGGEGTFLKTNDGGLSWTLSIVNPSSDLTSVNFTSADIGYINNAGGIYKTTDGGSTWEIQTMNIPENFRQIQFGSENVGYAVTFQGIYKTTNGGETTAVSELNSDIHIKVFPNPSQNVIKLNYPADVKIQNIELIDMAGKTIKSFSNPPSSIDVSDIPAGTYLLRLTTNAGPVVKKFVIG